MDTVQTYLTHFLKTNQILALLFCGNNLLLVSTWEKYSLPRQVEKLLSLLLCAAVYTQKTWLPDQIIKH